MGKKILKAMAGCGCGFLLFLAAAMIFIAVTGKSDPKKLAVLQSQADSQWRQLANLAGVVNSFYIVSESSCDDVSQSQQPTLRLIHADDLSRFNPDQEQPAELRWSWLNHFSFYDGTLAPKKFESEREANDMLYKLNGLAEKKLLGVIKTQTLQLPKQLGDGFDAGVIRGTLLVVELKSNRVMCAATFQAMNSAEVTYRTRGMLAKDAHQAISVDFQKNTKTALQAVLSRILPKYKIDGVANPPKP